MSVIVERLILKEYLVTAVCKYRHLLGVTQLLWPLNPEGCSPHHATNGTVRTPAIALQVRKS